MGVSGGSAAVAARPSGAKDRRLAALSHLGMPLCGVLLPLLLSFADDARTPFCKVHVHHALGFQIRFFLVVLVFMGLQMALPENQVVYPAYLLACAAALGLEIPNVRRALAGDPPRCYTVR